MPDLPTLSVIHVAAPAAVGGLERVVQALAIGQYRRGHRVRVAAVIDQSTDDHPFLAPLRDAGVPVDVLRIGPRAYLGERRFVRHLCKQHRPDVLHTHGYRPDLLDSGVARRLGIATATTLHGSSRLGGKTHFYEWLQELALRRFDAVAAVSAPLARALEQRGVPQDRIHLIPNAWQGDVAFASRERAREKLGLPQRGLVLGWVGRIIRAKGGDVLIEALARLRDVPWTAVIIGDGPERPTVERLISSHDLTDRVRLFGHLDDAAPLFRAFDLFALTSRTEGTPIVLFEAMAAGVPVVATRVGGVPDVVSEGEASLVAPEDPDALAAAIREACADPDGAAGRAQKAGKRLSAAFGRDRWLTSYEALYSSIRRTSPARATPS